MPRLLLKRKVNFLLEDSSVQGQEMLSERNTKIQVPPHQKKVFNFTISQRSQS